MPAKIRLTNRARTELHKINSHLIENAGWRMAERVITTIENRVDLLADFPRMGPERNDLGPGRRIFVSRPYIVVYRIDGSGEDEQVVILHVVHGARDLDSLFSRD